MKRQSNEHPERGRWKRHGLGTVEKARDWHRVKAAAHLGILIRERVKC